MAEDMELQQQSTFGQSDTLIPTIKGSFSKPCFVLLPYELMPHIMQGFIGQKIMHCLLIFVLSSAFVRENPIFIILETEDSSKGGLMSCNPPPLTPCVWFPLVWFNMPTTMDGKETNDEEKKEVESFIILTTWTFYVYDGWFYENGGNF